ncbi:MAG: InlB B-repeat-containing protein, partial [Clostridia bacterium]|nr:InlB B-repeat-containing protein [Clostridia bacterium]
MEKTKRNWFLTGLLAMLMMFGLCLGFGLNNQVQTVHATDDEPPPWDPSPGGGYTVSFDSNGGTGTMTAEDIMSGNYTLPACTFTPPSGKQFLCWAAYSTTGTQYNSGTQYNVYTSVTFYAIWEDVPKEFTSVPSNATRQVGQTFTATWTVNFDTTEYNVLVWDDEWDDYISIYHYNNDTITAGTQMSYNITSDVAGEKRYKIDCFYDYWNDVTSDEFVITWEAAPADELAGTVAINGNLKFGATLTASLTNTNNT